MAAMLLAGCATATDQAEPVPASAPADAVQQLRDRASIALTTRRAAQAKQLFTSVLAEAPDDAEAMTGLGEAEILLGNYDAALHHSRKALELVGERADLAARARQNAGIALLLTNRSAEAETELEDAIELDPSSWRAWNALGRARDARRAWNEAAAAYEQARALAPAEGAVLNNLGVSKLSAGHPNEAAPLFMRALEVDPDLASAETNLRLALALDGRYDEALAGVDVQDRPAALNNAGYAALLRGDHAKARALFLQAIDASPSFYEPAYSNLRFLGSIEERQSDAEGDAS